MGRRSIAIKVSSTGQKDALMSKYSIIKPFSGNDEKQCKLCHLCAICICVGSYMHTPPTNPNASTQPDALL